MGAITQRVRAHRSGPVRAHPGHAAQHVAGVDRQRRAPPGEPIGFADLPVERLRVLRAAPVLPDDRRRQRLARGVDEDMGVDLRAQPEAGDGARRQPGGEFAERGVDASRPVRRILLDEAGAGAGGGKCARIAADRRAGGVEQRRLDRGRADVDADQERPVHALAP